MAIPNTMQSDKWKVYFSNFPSVMQKEIDIRYLNHYVKNITLPDMSISYIDSTFGAFTTAHPVNMLNDYQPQVSIEFNISEGLYNYAAFFQYFVDLKAGRISVDETTFKDHCFNYIRVEILDNKAAKDIESTVIELTNCKMVSLSSLPLVYGSSEYLSFTVGLRVEEIQFKTGLVVPQIVLPTIENMDTPGLQDQYNPLELKIKND